MCYIALSYLLQNDGSHTDNVQRRIIQNEKNEKQKKKSDRLQTCSEMWNIQKAILF